ncbi:MAG: hypothetical protein K2Z81_19785 [Cyanobacteria bacterium]|nr:hypothetical protein [Cyanobacteriota bacterium]
MDSNERDYAINRAAIELVEVPDLFSRIFDRVDSDRNGFASEEELRAARFGKNNTSSEALASIVVNEFIHEIEELSNDEWGDENDGITRSDLKELKKLASNDGSLSKSQQRLLDDMKELLPGVRNVRDPRVFARALMDNFGKLDIDQNDLITEEEVNQTLTGVDSMSELAVLATGMKKHFEDLSGIVDDVSGGISWNDSKSFRYAVDPRLGFDYDLRNERVNGVLGVMSKGSGTLMFGLTTAFFGYGTAFLPELGVVALGTGAATVVGAGEVYDSYRRPIDFKADYERRQRMLQSWQFFSEKK